LSDRWNRKYGDASVGYAKDFSANRDYRAMGLTCPYEHCIENMPLGEGPSEGSCPVFGHDCPGGPKMVRTCKEPQIWGRLLARAKS
jgi:hypothetical protein